MRQWFAIYCRPRQELRALENLQRQGYSVFFPQMRLLRQRRAGLVPVIESLFPRYIFILLDNINDNWAPIRSTRGVVELVKSAGRPLAVPDAVIEELSSRQVVGLDYIDLVGSSDLVPGEEVHITSGPFAGNPAEFYARKADDRVVVLLNIMHSKQTIELPARAVARV
ncbi:MAG TPA: transcription/translation regulatory transformer protein RfaH [Spongiibacteraceae bacterium]|nr:transcription/translation regulatory transformer protein RfaH [Spongiibacteraceae bacterium]HCS29508.1 transcription/translation regulatory transformer protein RfaH [Spongiibacteraceae bacterium]|tara:strand:+ start:1344 stop:1847 length:504 start_codon:yes stop_codon:yes gene_type:complete